MLNGDAGIGKLRLVQMVKEHIAWYPIIDFLQRFLHFQSDEAIDAKLEKLERALSPYRLALHDTIPLVATLLSLLLLEARYASLHLTPQRQKQKTLEVLLAIV